MKKNHFLLFSLFGLLLSTQLITNAQNIEASWGQEIKPEKSTTIYKVIANDKDGYLITKGVGCGLFGDCKKILVRYNMNHEIQYEIELPSTINGKDAKREGTFHVEGKTFTFLSLNDKKNDINRLYVLRVGDKGEIGTEKLIDEINYDGKKTIGGFDISYLANTKSFMIIHDAGFSKKGLEQTNYKSFDLDFKLLWEKDIELEYQDRKFEIQSYRFDEEGNVFMYGTLLVGKNSGTTKNDIEPIIFAYYHKTGKWEKVSIGFDKAYAISNVRLNYHKGDLHLVGFYYDKKGGIQGLASTKIDGKTLKVEQEKTIPFSKEAQLTLTSEREGKKDKGIDRNYEIREIYYADNGDYSIVAEEYYERTTYRVNTQTNTQTVAYTHYYYTNIAVISLTESGSINWVQRIPKTQISKNDGGHYSSFHLVADNNNFYFLFNDNIKNLAPNIDPKKKGKAVANTLKTGKLVVNLTTLNRKTGGITSELFFKTKTDGKTSLVPKMCQRLNGTTSFLYADKGKSYRFGFLKVKDK